MLVCYSFAYGARIEDLTDVRGSRSNQLVGYGIVTGLAGQGDSLRIEYTELGILNALKYSVSVLIKRTNPEISPR